MKSPLAEGSRRMSTADPPKLEPPDLQEWVRRYGGYNNIPWADWDRANAEYQTARRERLKKDQEGR